MVRLNEIRAGESRLRPMNRAIACMQRSRPAGYLFLKIAAALLNELPLSSIDYTGIPEAHSFQRHQFGRWNVAYGKNEIKI